MERLLCASIPRSRAPECQRLSRYILLPSPNRHLDLLPSSKSFLQYNIVVSEYHESEVASTWSPDAKLGGFSREPEQLLVRQLSENFLLCLL